MSYSQNASWSPSEKVDLLVNVLRSTVPDVPLFLMQTIHDRGIYPQWNDTPLPPGRSLASSQIAYEEMSRPFKQKGHYSAQSMGIPHVPAMAPVAPGRRPYSEYDPFVSQQQQRTLQPRPPRSTDSPIPNVTNGEVSGAIRPILLPDATHEPQRKKRGRPSKEEAEERDRALAAEGKVYQPKKRPAKKIRPSLDAPSSSRNSEFGPLGVQTPPGQTPENREEHSSGKKRAKRQLPETEAEAATDEHLETHDRTPQPGPRSPSDRLLATHRERDLDMLLTKEPSRSPSNPVTKQEDGEP